MVSKNSDYHKGNQNRNFEQKLTSSMQSIEELLKLALYQKGTVSNDYMRFSIQVMGMEQLDFIEELSADNLYAEIIGLDLIHVYVEAPNKLMRLLKFCRKRNLDYEVI